MASNTSFFQHPLHQEHPLEPLDFSKARKPETSHLCWWSIPKTCHLCWWSIAADAYACQKCSFYTHRVCAEAPPKIDLHPLHTQHPLTLVPRPQSSEGKTCSSCFTNHKFHCTVFRCDECDFNLDIRCTLSTSSDRGGTQGKAPEQIKLPLHPHTLTSFSTKHEFVVSDGDCVICKGSVKGEGYTCLRRSCSFLIHKRCVSDLSYKDGTKAAMVFHKHPLETFLGEDMSSSSCFKCLSEESSREFIGCASCGVFYCRDCVQVPESIQYPHHPHHDLVLFIDSTDNEKLQRHSGEEFLKDELCYACPLCEFFVDVECALKVLSYREEGMSAEMKPSWHQHPLILRHITKDPWNRCSHCEGEAVGPVYACSNEDCELILHEACIEIESTINHPHHQDHPLTLGRKYDIEHCRACGELIYHLNFSCELCAFYIHARCAAHAPTWKHPLHEHELLHSEGVPSWECNRCGNNLSSPFFRCVPCDFNLHDKCMELPQVVKSEIHWHSLTLHENYVEDDSGEYYCDQCEQRRDVRLGAYVCEKCSARWAFHIECALPELGNVYANKIQTCSLKRMDERIKKRSVQIGAAEAKLEEAKRVLDDLKREMDGLTKEKEELFSGVTN